MARPVNSDLPPEGPVAVPRAGNRSILQSVERCLAVLDELAHRSGPRSVAELAASLGVDRTIVHRILRTLQVEDFVEHTSRGYVIGPRALVFGNAYRERLSVRSAALPYMADFAREVRGQQQMVSLGMVVREELLLVDQVWDPGMSLDLVFVGGSRFPVDQTASAPALWAYAPLEEVARVIGADRRRELEPRLAEIRAAGGVAFQRRPENEGHCAIVATIFPQAGRPQNTLILSGLGLEDQLFPESSSARRVRRYANRIGELI